MPSFAKASLDRLATCHPDLIRLFNEVIKTQNCIVLEGHRGQDAQHQAYASGHSKLDWPKGKHNASPSLAVDVAPYPVDWKYTEKFYFFAGHVIAEARRMNINLRWGGNWKGDGDLKGNKFNDLVHFELVPKTLLAGK